MSTGAKPREVVKRLLQGVAPARPLFLPIVFSHGAKVEGVSLRAFLTNPTKISSSLRQIHGVLRCDGLTCYFDPTLEAEALGARLEWASDECPPTLHWPESARKGQLPSGLRAPEDAVRCGRVPVAVEVIRRLKSLLRDEPLLMAGVEGPFTLATRLTQLDREHSLDARNLPDAALEVASSVITQISAAYLEAGANLIFIHEEFLPTLLQEDCETWASRLAPTINIIRFYEALPVLLLTDINSVTRNSGVIFDRAWDGLLCPAFDVNAAAGLGGIPVSRSSPLGIALPPAAVQSDDAGTDAALEFFQRAIPDLRPAIVTTAGDLSPTTDLKRLVKLLEDVPRAS